jgi:hypothetical protein
LWLVVLAITASVGALAWWIGGDDRASAEANVASEAPQARPDARDSIASKLASNATVITSAASSTADSAANAVVSARLIDDLREPLAGLEIGVTLHVRSVQRGNASVSQPVTTDRLGTFRVPFPIACATDVGGTLSLVVTSRGPMQRAEATFQLPSDIHAGDNDLGDIIARVRPIVLAGQVIELRTGRPVEHVAIEAVLQDAPETENNKFHAVSDADGRFKIEGECPQGVLRVTARREGYKASSDLSVASGTRRVRVVMSYGASLAGRVLFDPGCPVSEAEVVLYREVPDSLGFHGEHVKSVNLGTDGSFAFSSLEPGDVDLHVSCKGSWWWSTDHIHLRAGEDADDPRLRCIDLRGQAHCFQLTIVDETDRPVDLCLIHASSESFNEGFEARGGTCTIFTREPKLDLFFEADGFRPQRMVGVSTDQRVVLKRGIPIRLRWHGALPFPDRRFRVVVSLTSSDTTKKEFGGTNANCDSGSLEFDATGELAGTVPLAGTYTVYWTVKSARTPQIQSLMEPKRATIKIIESDEEQAFDVCPDPVRLTDALKFLEQN